MSVACFLTIFIKVVTRNNTFYKGKYTVEWGINELQCDSTKPEGACLAYFINGQKYLICSGENSVYVKPTE